MNYFNSCPHLQGANGVWDILENATIEALDEAEKDLSSVGYGIGSYRPIYRSGGLWSAFAPDYDITIGRNIAMSYETQKAYLHETAHFYQQIYEGSGRFYSRGMVEQWFMANPYRATGTQEHAADLFYYVYRR